MNFNSPSSPSTPFTNTFKQFPEYKNQEHSLSTVFSAWQTSADLNSKSLNHIEKVKKVLCQAQESIEGGSLFTKNTLYDTSLIAYRREIVHTEANAILSRYSSPRTSLEKRVVNITKSIHEVANNLSSLQAKKEGLLKQLQQVSDDLIIFRDQVQTDKKEHERLAIAKDKRCLKKNIKPFDKVGFQHSIYKNQVQKWQAEGAIDLTASAEDCWKWKGKIKALHKVENQVAYLANSLHAAECCLSVLQANETNDKFQAQSESPRNFVFGPDLDDLRVPPDLIEAFLIAQLAQMLRNKDK